MIRQLLTTTIIMATVSLQTVAIDVLPACRLAEEIHQEVKGVTIEMQVVACDSVHKTPTYYVFEPAEGEGYYIISAGEEPELLAYSENGSYQPEQLPVFFTERLSLYSETLNKHKDFSVRKAMSAPQATQNINPLIHTGWAQATPYNNLCPELNGERSLTGCTATAMAQVMYYHKYPNQPTGSGSATLDWQKLPDLNFSDYLFDWDNMLTEYNGVIYTEEQANAVATLMLLCGYGARMNYTPSGSGAFVAPARGALINNFGYSTSARMYLRRSYERKTWLAMITAELAAGRPIIYSGRTANNDGHTFVCDGIGSRNRVHINWGWGTNQNIFVDVDILTPTGASDGYSRDVEIVMGIQPPLEGEDRTIPYNLDICDSLTFKPSNKMLVVPSIYNLGPDVLTLNIALRLCNSQGATLDYLPIKNSVRITSDSYCQPNYSVLSLPTLEDGEYSLQMVVKPSGTNDWITVNPGDRTDGFTFSIADGKMTFGQLTSIGQIEASTNRAIENRSYNLSGTRLDSQKPGFSIRNGKVIFVR